MTLYLYAIVGPGARGPFGKGMRGALLSTVSAGGARVVVQEGPRFEPTMTAMRAHDRVVRRIARRVSAVLPFRFGSTVTDARALRQLLAPLSSAIARALEHVDECVQMTMRVYGRRARAPRPSRDDGPGTRFLRKRLASGRVPEVLPISRATAPFVRDTRVQRHEARPLLASVYHLVPRVCLPEFREAVARSSADLRGVTVQTTGPFPPYAFAEIP